MKPTENMEDAIKKDLNFTAGADLHDRMLNDVLNAQEKSKRTKPAATKPDIRRQIMKSPMTKLAAAVVVIIAVLIVILLPGGSRTGVAWGEVLERAEQVPTVIFDMTVEIDYPEGKKLVLPSKNYVAGDYGTRSDIYLDGTLSMIKYRLPTKKVAYQVRIDRKQYWRIELSDEQAARGRDPDDPRTWLKMILSGDYIELGRTTINGVIAEGIECNRPEMVGEDGIMRLWVDVETNLPAQIEVDMLGMEGGQMRQHTYVMENFEWNASLDESLFEPDIPEDYTQGEDPRADRNRQESTGAQQTPPPALTEQEQAAQSKVKEVVRLFLQACSNENWDEILKHRPGFEKLSAEQRESMENQLGGLEIMEIGEPFKRDASDTWHVPCRLRWKMGADNDEVRVRYEEALRRFVVCGGP
ncbi:hypothetical protein ACFL5Z_10520 [Planctomycetota bacterium]